MVLYLNEPLMLICSPLPNNFRESMSYHTHGTWRWAESLSPGTHSKSTWTQETCTSPELSMLTCITRASPEVKQSRCSQSMMCTSSVAHKMLFSCTRALPKESAGMHMSPGTNQELLSSDQLQEAREQLSLALFMFVVLLPLCGLFIILKSITFLEFKYEN